MRRPIIVLGFLLAGTIAWACGDKLMLVMGSRSSQIRGLHPAAILVYPGESAGAPLMRSLLSQTAIRKAGHHLQIVEDSAGLDTALKGGRFDLVMADVSDANAITEKMASAASKPVLLPVAFKASKEEQSAAQKKYHCLLKVPGNSDNYLDAIDRAMELKLKGAAR
jgi:hypothetical protein